LRSVIEVIKTIPRTVDVTIVIPAIPTALIADYRLSVFSGPEINVTAAMPM
jgi:hypothetical protein